VNANWCEYSAVFTVFLQDRRSVRPDAVTSVPFGGSGGVKSLAGILSSIALERMTVELLTLAVVAWPQFRDEPQNLLEHLS
jgi:hypothetical protein